MLRLTFNPGLALTGFRTALPGDKRRRYEPLGPVTNSFFSLILSHDNVRVGRVYD